MSNLSHDTFPAFPPTAPVTALPLSAKVPEVIKAMLEAIKEKPETQAFLTITAVSASFQALATSKAQQMSPAEFQTWAQGAGELFQEQLGFL